MRHPKEAQPDHPVHDLIAKRWSPYVFADRPVPLDDLRSLFEAARWSASSYNEQPWRYIVATQDNTEAFEKMLSCLVDANQAWAKRAPVLVLGVIGRRFTRNDKPNRVAEHDLGLASATLTFEATSRGLYVHQMAGLNPDLARDVYGIPDGFDTVTALAIGYPGAPDLEPELGTRDQNARTRRPLSEFVFHGAWEKPANFE